jgi:hypothetical protein
MRQDNTHKRVIPAKPVLRGGGGAGIHSANPEPARPPDSSRAGVVHLLATLAVLAAFVWALWPDRPNVQPAPLRPPDAACPQLGGQFTPTNFTELPGLDLASLSQEGRNRVLLRLNMEPCPCGCNTSLAYCLVSHTRCEKCKELAQEIIAEESALAGASRPPSGGHAFSRDCGITAGSGSAAAAAGRSRDSGPAARATSGEKRP